MLQNNIKDTDRLRLPVNLTPPGQTDGGGITEIINLGIGLLRRQYLVILVTAALVIAISLLYLRLASPTYTAQVQILLANPRAQFVQQQSLLAEPPFDLNQIETQIQLVRSKATAAAVIDQLKLTNDPDLNASGPSLHSLWQRIRSWARAGSTQDAPSGRHVEPSDAIVDVFLSRLSASRVGYSNVIEISFNSSSAARAAEIVNAIANTYVTDQLNAKFDANRRATSWLQDRLRDLGDQALAAQRAVDVYKSQNNIVSLDGRLIDEHQITEINNRLALARAQTSEATAKLSRYETLLASFDPKKPSSMLDLDAIGSDGLNSAIITALRQQYLELTRREAELTARVGRDHLAVVNVRNRAREFRVSIFDEVRRLAEVSRSEFELAKQRQEEIEKQLAKAVAQSRSVNSAELTIKDLESRAKGLRSLYETFLQRYMSSAQQETFPISETRVLFPASPPSSKSKPKTRLVLALGIVGGLALGIGLALLRDLMDRVFRTSSQVESVLELPCLSMVPFLPSRKSQKPAVRLQKTEDDVQQRIVSPPTAIHRTVVGMPLSRYTEAIRSIKLAIDHNPEKISSQVIGITSALPNEGKTTIAASLAQLIGHAGKSAIIVDCDLRNPSLSSIFAPKAACGILEVANGSRSLADAIWRDPTTNLAFLPAVRRGPLLHTSEILCADAISKLFDRLRAQYDYIIVDLPPLTPLVDVRATSSLIDCYILVVEWGRTKIDVVQHALHTAPNIQDSLIGVVLSKTDTKAMARYDGHRSYYYHDSHYIRYGLSGS
ncbi:Wzz/FepE/Etk N-terminal domain-containing protein [Bradyrhizobium daqingense]|uniref:non-specific protein-tyrosine kinase n=1 Tax=Bradyrhizobium daqingense TaxID=993502 RepID=A0A562KZD7_9BRAD|nr:Wzz/FepE/Etk N-terminal domain-containing protein [Bradyrhizobium daqingense]TWI00713.1 exopolysaccharide transport family protein [Bradyrhizobium daqingense]UFS92908.1 Wzz/FepE/Etk N-terminal domain-containing protein [Bradyrhizobium daqingense]